METSKQISLSLLSVCFSKQRAEIMVRKPKFEPFGEPIAIADVARTPASRWLARAGAGIFWALVITIVVARAIYFEQGVFNCCEGWEPPEARFLGRAPPRLSPHHLGAPSLPRSPPRAQRVPA